MKSGCSTGGVLSLRPPKVMKNVSVRQPPSVEPLPFPLSSRAKPRDLRFSGPFVEMFFSKAQRRGEICGFSHTHTTTG